VKTKRVLNAREDRARHGVSRFRSGAALLLAALALALGAGACSTANARSDFIRRGDQVCEAQQAEIVALVGSEPQHVTSESLPQFRRIFARLATLFQNRLDGLKTLDPPDGDEARIGAILADLERSVTALEQSQQAAASGDPALLVSIAQRGNSLAQRISQSFREYGFNVCGR
jgi:hypothetical protein